MVEVHYAMQICDIANNQTDQRYCNTDRTTLSKKSIRSFLNSVIHAAIEIPEVKHHILFVDDHSSVKLKLYLDQICKENLPDNVSVTVEHTVQHGLMSTVKHCYQWLYDQGKWLVYQIQDDYLFSETAIKEMINVFFQMKAECNTESIISPCNDPWLWVGPYRNRVTPRVVISGKNRYWISFYDMSCSFMTSISVFKQNWDLLEAFCNMPARGQDGNLENVTLNRMLVERGILGLVPITSLALHIQSELEKDPYISWEEWWNKVH